MEPGHAISRYPGVWSCAGGIADETIVYVDGAKKEGTGYAISDECWMGKIDKKDPNKIEWSKLPPHPGPAVSTSWPAAGSGNTK